MSGQALDRPGHRGVDLLGQVDQEGQGLNITVSDAAAAGAQDAADEGTVLVVLDLPSWPFRCQPTLTVPGLESCQRKPKSGQLAERPRPGQYSTSADSRLWRL